eukprot:15337098-Ditylum_brightwellii.AAC.1
MGLVQVMTDVEVVANPGLDNNNLESIQNMNPVLPHNNNNNTKAPETDGADKRDENNEGTNAEMEPETAGRDAKEKSLLNMLQQLKDAEAKVFGSSNPDVTIEKTLGNQLKQIQTTIGQ